MHISEQANCQPPRCFLHLPLLFALCIFFFLHARSHTHTAHADTSIYIYIMRKFANAHTDEPANSANQTRCMSNALRVCICYLLFLFLFSLFHAHTQHTHTHRFMFITFANMQNTHTSEQTINRAAFQCFMHPPLQIAFCVCFYLHTHTHSTLTHSDTRKHAHTQMQLTSRCISMLFASASAIRSLCLL